MIAMNSKHLWSVIIASEDSYDSHDQWSHMIAMNTDCEQSLFIGTAMNLDSERSMIKHIIHDEVGSMLWNAGVHTWSTLILYHIMTPSCHHLFAPQCSAFRWGVYKDFHNHTSIPPTFSFGVFKPVYCKRVFFYTGPSLKSLSMGNLG